MLLGIVVVHHCYQLEQAHNQELFHIKTACFLGRVFRGKMRVGDNVSLIKLDGTVKNFRVTKIFGFFGLK
jgi:predicted membrane GTPase involved in stress response